MGKKAQRISIPDQVLFRDLGDEAVILELESGQYYGLNDVGTSMWRALEEHREVESACRALLEMYEVPEDELRRDCISFVDLLASRQLVVVEEQEDNAAEGVGLQVGKRETRDADD